MTTTPPVRTLSLPVDLLADLFDGYLCLFTNFEEGWSVGLIYDEGAREEDANLALRTERSGVPIIWLDDIELQILAGPQPADLRGHSGVRYLITVEDVEDLVDLLDERQAARDED